MRPSLLKFEIYNRNRLLADIVSSEVRSRMMSGIRSKNTKPEMIIRCGLHRLGLRFRLHDSKLPGKPDLVFPKYGAVVFVNGCFWHGHDCRYFKLPQTRTEFWFKKISTNKIRDMHLKNQIEVLGWRHATIWECELKRKNKEEIIDVLERTVNWITQNERLS